MSRCGHIRARIARNRSVEVMENEIGPRTVMSQSLGWSGPYLTFTEIAILGAAKPC